MIKVGDIAFVEFPFEEKRADRLHPVLVLDVQAHNQCVVAYGTSKQVDRHCPRKREVVIADEEHLKQVGLSRPTRFDVGLRARIFVPRRSLVGKLPVPLHGCLYRAAVECGLLGG
jgi:hypothetical protein